MLTTDFTKIAVCGGHLTASTNSAKIFSHAKFGDVNYDNKEDCDWIIEAPSGKKCMSYCPYKGF